MADPTEQARKVASELYYDVLGEYPAVPSERIAINMIMKVIADQREKIAQKADQESKCKRSGFKECVALCNGWCDFAQAIRRGE